MSEAPCSKLFLWEVSDESVQVAFGLKTAKTHIPGPE
jgi:hypothetical protein